MNDASAHHLPADDRRALMSALADGEVSALQQGCALWRDDADARATWHAYHLIGDVMRSDDLAVRPRRDADFLAGVRARLAAEPTVLAPAPVVPSVSVAQGRERRRHAWLAPAAVAAGFVAVAGVLVVARLSGPSSDGPVLAINPTPGAAFSYAGDGVAQRTQPLVIEGRLVRDARLDSYLRAHREALGGVPAAVPGGVPRSMETLAPMPQAVSATVQR